MKDSYGIKPLGPTQIPGHHIALATLSRSTRTVDGHHEEWLCATAEYWPWTPESCTVTDYRCAWQPADLWMQVTTWAKGKGLTFLWLHDLHRTARITKMLAVMPLMGWTLHKLSLNPASSWLVWRKGRDTVKVVDLMSIWPTSLDRIGQLLGYGRGGPWHDSDPELRLRKIADMDAKIVRAAAILYTRKIEQEDLGRLSVTGNGQAWAAFRRRHLDHGILVHHIPELHDLERRAMWTGRAEAWWRGAWLDQPVDEWDFANAHTNIGLTHDVPVYPHQPIEPGTALEKVLGEYRYLALAEIEVTTDAPCLPAQLGDHIAWPVGRFRTAVWTPELRLAMVHGRDVRVLGGWLYRRAPALRRWADWVLAQLALPESECPAWWRDIVKRWGNTLIGRFAMRYPRWEHIGDSPVSDVHCVPCLDLRTDEEYFVMQVGHALWKQSGLDVPHNQAPAITSYVMSAMRAKLWALIAMMPARSLLYVDTDSLLVTDKWRDHMYRLAESTYGEGLRLKRSWEGMAIYGPRQLVTGDQARVSGLPKTAVRVGRHDWEGEVTESLLDALADRQDGTVRLFDRSWRLEGVDPRRDGTGVGWTKPKVVQLDPRGGDRE